MKSTGSTVWYLAKETVTSWLDDYAPSMGAALAFYTLFSTAPLLLITIALAGYFFGADAARSEIIGQLGVLMGPDGARTVHELSARASEMPHRSVAAAVGIVVFLVGATSVFNELQNSLNRMWRVPRAPRAAGIRSMLRGWLLSLGMILALSFVLILVLVISATFSAVRRQMGADLPDWGLAFQLLNGALGFALVTVMFALMFKTIPQVMVHWGDVWIGAAITSTLFEVGTLFVGVYLAHGNAVSAFGKVGSVALFLLWVYYSAQAFLLGAKFTYIYSTSKGHTPARPRRPVRVSAVARLR